MSHAPSAAPSTSDYVRFHALHRPGAIALVEDGREIDYATFDRDLRTYTRALRQLGLPRGAVVAVACEKFYEHWLMLLACEDLGWATVSFLTLERGSLEQLFAHVELVLTVGEFAKAGNARWHRVTREWLAKAGALPEPDDAPGAPMGLEEAQRVRRSSGTTGGLKMMIGTRHVEEQWVLRYLQYMGFTPQSRLLLTAPFTVGAMYSGATACLRLGATCIWSSKLPPVKAIQTERPTHVRLFQFQIGELLDNLPDGFKETAELTLILGAAPVPAVMWKKIEERLTSRIIYGYNCNEAGGIGTIDREGVCTLRPGVRAEIVDERGAPVAAGEVGQVRVRTASMVDGYLDNPEATARSFRDGWFYTGDAGTMMTPGRLKLTGRSDELLNIRGRKFSPVEIEDAVACAAPVESVAVTSIPNRDGLDELCVAFVLNDKRKGQEYSMLMRGRLPRDFGRVHFLVVDSIPRTEESGKIKRGELKKLFEAMAK